MRQGKALRDEVLPATNSWIIVYIIIIISYRDYMSFLVSCIAAATLQSWCIDYLVLSVSQYLYIILMKNF